MDHVTRQLSKNKSTTICESVKRNGGNKMGLFDLFKSKETIEQERYEREAREKHEAEEKQKREWDSLSEEEKGRRVKKEQDDFNSAARERREIEAIWFKRGVSVLKNRPGEYF